MPKYDVVGSVTPISGIEKDTDQLDDEELNDSIIVGSETSGQLSILLKAFGR